MAKQTTDNIMEHLGELNIYEKMSLITEAIGVVQKGLDVKVSKSASYKAVSERDVLDAVKPIEHKFRVYSYPVSRDIIENELLTKTNRYNNGDEVQTNSLYLRLVTVYRFVNLDKPDEFIETTVFADGIDTGDKACGKAMTYADKYALMKMYKLSTGDDPDKEASEPNGYRKASGKSSAKAVQNSEPKTEPILMATPEQVKQMTELFNENQMAYVLQKNNIKSLEELPMAKASRYIEKAKQKETNNEI